MATSGHGTTGEGARDPLGGPTERVSSTFTAEKHFPCSCTGTESPLLPYPPLGDSVALGMEYGGLLGDL